MLPLIIGYDLDARFGSISHVLLLGPEERQRLFDEMHAAVGDQAPIVIEMTTIVEIAATA